MHFCTSMFSPGKRRKNIFIIFPGHTQTLEGGGGQPNVQSTKLWIILVHYSDTCTLLQPQTDQKLWSAKSGWSRSEDHMGAPNSSSYFYTSFIYCLLIAITSMDRDPVPISPVCQHTLFITSVRLWNIPQMILYINSFLILVSWIRCEWTENKNKSVVLTQALWEM